MQLTQRMSLKEAGKLFIALDEVERNTDKLTRYPQPEGMCGTYLVLDVDQTFLHFRYERNRDVSEQIVCDWFAQNCYQLRKVRKMVGSAMPQTQRDIEYALKASYIPLTKEVNCD